ncbi:uncharacterized protein TNCV_349601 [Trichonephila clavipes]|nr:uncharacterized protein TNCV_349601 [Trichonephila clavipes]
MAFLGKAKKQDLVLLAEELGQKRQAKRIGVEKTNLVSALLRRMPSNITQLIARESEDKFDNYDYIKGVLLKRFKMSPDTFRVCHAENHKKTSPNRQINAVETNERFQEQSSAILTAKVAIPVYSPTKEDEKIDELKLVRIKCGNEIMKAVIDTGAQISMVRADVVEG